MSRRPIVIRVREEALDDEHFPLGVIRIAPDRTVTYANRAMREMVGGELQPGMRITDLALDGASRATLDAALQTRFAEERGSGYPLVMRRGDRGTLVRGRVAALPEYDSDGFVKGSIGFVTDETLDSAATAIHQAIEQALTPEALLRGLASCLRQVIHFDRLMVTAIGRDGMHLRSMFDTDPEPTPSPFRWWPMPHFVQLMLREFRPGPFDLDAFFDGAYGDQARNNPELARFRSRGFQHSLRMMASVRGCKVAMVTLLRARGRKPFTEDDQRACERLPIVDAITWSMAMDEQLQQRFATAVVNRMMRAGNRATDAAQRLVDDLWRHFKWHHVSLFLVAEDRGRVQLVSQACSDDRQRLPDAYEQSFEIGLLGRCVRTRKPVNVPDVSLDADYRLGVADVRSELVMPLPGRKVRWLLNIESSILNAFSEEEERALARLLRVAAFVLDRAAMVEMHETIMANVGDAIIETNELNVIREVNAAGCTLLGYTRDQMIGRDLRSFLEVAGDAAPPEPEDAAPQPWDSAPTDVGEFDERSGSVVETADRASEIARFVKSDGSKLSMLVSSAKNPGLFGGKIFVASDLSGKQFLDRVERLTPIVRQLASEIRVPLALASAFLEHSEADPQLAAKARQQLEKARHQIASADLSIENLVQAAAAADDVALGRTPFELAAFLGRLKGSFPEARQSSLRIRNRESEPVSVRAAQPQLLLCVQTLLAHLLRAAGPSQVIEMEIGRSGRRHARLVLRLCTPEGSPVAVEGSMSAAEMLMIDAVVPSLMRRMGGRYLAPTPGQPQFTLILSLG